MEIVKIELTDGKKYCFTGEAAIEASHISQIGDCVYFGEVLIVPVDKLQSYLSYNNGDERMISEA